MSPKHNGMYHHDFEIAREHMVARDLRPKGIHDPRVLKAIGKVPRHLFVDEALWDQAYGDYPLPIGYGQTISQPYIVAIMTQELGLKGQERVLEIGTGSGYQTAVLAELAKAVFSVERISALLSKARRILDKLGYSNVHLKLDDGTWGWKDHAPFDAILVAAASPQIPQPLVDQLKDPGIMLIPVGDEYSQTLVKLIKEGGRIYQEEMGGVRFVKLVGDHGWKA